jgi:phosphoribosylaminoimidazolecarboxamide formyltransferase/IMP cyclohydrolase
MAQDMKAAYRTIMDDHFPPEMKISFGDQTLIYRKRVWKITDEDSGERVEKGLRYGENPGQEAALYELVNGHLVLGECRFIEPGRGLVSALSEADLLQVGKHPSKTNLTDVDNGLNILKFLTAHPCVAILKHNNPCGVAQAETLAAAYERAYWADRLAAMGGAVVCNRPIDAATAELISQSYVEVVAAPEYEKGAAEILARRKNLRIIRVPRMDKLAEYAHARYVDFKSLVDGGIIVQQSPLNRIRRTADFIPATAKRDGREYRCERQPTEKELADLLFGWQVEQGVTSNSVIYVKDGVTVGIGTGEQDRVGVAQIAANKAYTKYADGLCFKRYGVPYYELARDVERHVSPAHLKEAIDAETDAARGGLMGSVMISDGFFPFRDGVDVGIREGITAVVQPGGSDRDFEVIQACNEANPKVAMVFTGQRAFKH